MKNNRIFCLVYKDDAALYLPAGANKQISCSHLNLDIWGVNMQGEEVPVPFTTIPPLSASPGNSEQSANALVRVGGVWVNSKYFGDPNFKVCVKVKDYTTRNTLYVDAASYNANIALCNFVPEPQSCTVVTNLVNTAKTATTANFSFVLPAGAVGVEYINNTTFTAPTGDGTYQDGGTTTIAITGLTTATTYYLHVRTICGLGSSSAWTVVTYTTS